LGLKIDAIDFQAQSSLRKSACLSLHLSYGCRTGGFLCTMVTICK
jgi:hypothetical protein